MGQKRRRSESSPEPGPNPHREPDRKILVAVDFGTTFSGLAWAQTRKPDVQTPIIMWPDSISAGLEGKTSDKVPTEMAYDGENYLWGYQIPESRTRHTWFKLDLDTSHDRGTSLINQYPNPLAAPPAYDKSAEKIATDYLTALRKHAEQILRYKIPESALDSIPIQYILTVPAVWSDLAQAKTRKCAEKAGMGNASSLQLISEPEAAAIYALEAMDPGSIKIGDTYVLCDAGGGTVDLITYTVDQLRPKLSLTEASVGTGSSCGSSFLNRRFQEFLEQKLAGEETFDAEVVQDAMNYFEEVVKRTFRGTFGENFLVPVPGMKNEALGIRRNKLSVTGSEVRQIFEPVLDEVTKLVIGQMKASGKAISAVILVGGFGQNAYVRDEISKEIKTVSATTKVMQSPNGWTAVVRGALMKGLVSLSPSFSTVNISQRAARKHYGIDLYTRWKPGMGDKHRRNFCLVDGFWKINVFECFVTKGSSIKEEHPLRVEFCVNQLVSEGIFKKYTTPILVCSDPTNQGPPKYPDQLGTKDLVEVSADLSHLSPHSFPIKRGVDGKLYYEVEFEIEITFYSAHTTYELIYDGKNYGAVSAEYV